jgi:16S rRNA (uracil1498-N3)-methyltransferase
VNLFYLPKIANGHTHLDAEESRHVVKVLRKVAGDELTITDGNGFFYQARRSNGHLLGCFLDDSL